MKGLGWLVSIPLVVMTAGCASTNIQEWVDLLKQFINQGRYEELALGLQDLYVEDAEAGDEVVSYGLDHVILPPDGNMGDLENSRALLDALDVPGGEHQTVVLYGKALTAAKSKNYNLAVKLFREVSDRVDVKDEHKAVCLLGMCRLDRTPESGEVNEDHWQAFVTLQDEVGQALSAEDLTEIRTLVEGNGDPASDFSIEALFPDK